MEFNVWKVVANVFVIVIVIEIISVGFWWFLSKYDAIEMIVYIIEFVIVFSSIVAILRYHRRKKKQPQLDERLQKHFDRSIMFAGIASLVALLQITIIEIITGLNFKAIEILVAVVMVYYVVVPVAYIVQNRTG